MDARKEPVFPRKTAQGSELHKGMSLFECVSMTMMGHLVSSGIRAEDFEEAKVIDPSFKDLKPDEYLSKRACQLANALIKEWEK